MNWSVDIWPFISRGVIYGIEALSPSLPLSLPLFRYLGKEKTRHTQVQERKKEKEKKLSDDLSSSNLVATSPFVKKEEKKRERSAYIGRYSEIKHSVTLTFSFVQVNVVLRTNMARPIRA